uniref:Uncharacterized protein n=1 Tax=Rhizophora mucronata TaxID=61149 RepID=A0A2P2IIW6_RHIMU
MYVRSEKSKNLEQSDSMQDSPMKTALTLP